MIAALAAPEILAEIGGEAEVIEELGGLTVTVSVTSSAISSVSYRLASVSSLAIGLMTVTMADGSTLEYPETPPPLFVGLVNAPSPGAFFNKNIRGRS